jgi:hypothetical protein
MQDRTIDNALLALRKQIIRGNLDGLDHVEALLRPRGVQMSAVLPSKRCDVARRGHMRLLVTEALGDGGKTTVEVAASVAAKGPEITPEAAHKRAALCLSRMKREGLLMSEGRVWSFSQRTER